MQRSLSFLETISSSVFGDFTDPFSREKISKKPTLATQNELDDDMQKLNKIIEDEEKKLSINIVESILTTAIKHECIDHTKFNEQ